LNYPLLRQEQNPVSTRAVSAEGGREDEMILQAQKDPRAFQPLYEKYFRQILLFVLRRVGDKSLAKDLTQQVFFKALLNIGRFQLRGFPFSSWLYRIAINECNGYFRKSDRIRWVALDEAQVETLYEELTADNIRDDWEKKLPGVLGQLKPDDLMVIELRYFEGKSFQEVADIMNWSVLNAKTRTYRILHKMKKMFLS
jgi:RNA polymerase sigma-70 factor (ECF subfamily)